MRVKLLAVLMTLGLALSPMSVMAQNIDFEATKALADKGLAFAQYNLGIMYVIGQGVAKNDVIAYKWSLLANAQDRQYSKLVDFIEPTLTPQQRAQGQALAAAFKPKTLAE
jgi:hypothetical protein